MQKYRREHFSEVFQFYLNSKRIHRRNNPDDERCEARYMITSIPHNFFTKADENRDCSLGNVLFTIAGIIGVATKNGYAYGFPAWPNQEYFKNSLPLLAENVPFTDFQNPINYKGYDIGFRGFDIPDNSRVNGYFGSEKYFTHCKDLIRKQFEMKVLCRPYENAIMVHYRNYNPERDIAWADLGRDYYLEAIKQFPKKKVVVVTDNIEKAKQQLDIPATYISNPPIIDFYLLTKAKYLVMANSTFSWWGAWLSQAKVVAPKNWYAGEFADCPTEDLYCEGWRIL
jgi:hypothetical protein